MKNIFGLILAIAYLLILLPFFLAGWIIGTIWVGIKVGFQTAEISTELIRKLL